jgi:hypothetical protein
MPEIPEVAYIFLYIAPGLMLVRALRLGGIGRRLQLLDTLSLSIVAAVALRWAAPRITDLLALEVEAGLELELALLLLALALGLIIAFGKRAYSFLFGLGGDEEEESPSEPLRTQPVEQAEPKTEERA